MPIYRGSGGAGDATNDATITAVQAAATSAATSATNAANSATAAATSASGASTSATNASNSATSSAGSATSSANSATTSSNFATNSSLSADDSAASAVEAAGYASDAFDYSVAASVSSGTASDYADSAIAASASAYAHELAAEAVLTDPDFVAVLAIAADIDALSPITADITTVAGIAADVTTVATDSADIVAVSANLDNIGIVAEKEADINAVVAIASDITAVAAVDTDVTTVAGIAANVTTVATNNANVTTVATNIASVNTVAGNTSNINQVASDTVAINSASANATTATTQAGIATTQAAAASASAAAASAVALGNEPVRHSVRPSLLLDFANTKTLDPRITFSRASTATYYDGKTTVVAEQNLALQSQTFDNAFWSKNNTSITANATTAPDGTSTAETMTGSVGISYVIQAVAVTSGLSYTLSVYAKANTTNFLQIGGGGSVFGTDVWANFDLSGGTVGTVGSLTTASITSVGSGWYRCVITGTATATSSIANSFGIISTESSSATRFPTNAGATSLYLWGAQAEQRSSVTAYTATTTAPITNYIPALQTAAAGVARFDHNPTTGESLGLLIEEQRTNLLLRSEEFDNASWSKLNATTTSLANIAPNGTLTAIKIVENTATGRHYVNQPVATTAVATTFSVYAKAAERSFVSLSIYDSSATQRNTWFNLASGTVGTTGTGITATINSVGNGWYRCVVTVGTSYSGTNQATISSSIIDNGISYVGDGYSGIYIWGAQLEAGAFATSYIPTVASQVTRSADSASMTGTNFSSWYRADEGTLYGEGLGSLLAQIGSNSNFNNRIRIHAAYTGGGNENLFVNNSAGVAQAALGTSSAGVSSFAKVAGAFAFNNFAVSINGGTSITSSTGALGTPDSLSIGSRNPASPNAFHNGTIKKLAYYGKRLSNAELQGLTTV